MRAFYSIQTLIKASLKGVLFFSFLLLLGTSFAHTKLPSALIKGKVFYFELAQTDEARARGYMFRNRVLPNDAMLFVFDEEEFHPFWMKNTRVSLDMIWLDAELRIVDIAESAEPYSTKILYPKAKSKYVIEFKANTAHQLGLKEGDLISLPFLRKLQ